MRDDHAFAGGHAAGQVEFDQRGRAFDFRRVCSWWGTVAYAVFALTGESFDVLSLPPRPAEPVLRSPELDRTPSIRTPYGVSLLVTPGVIAPGAIGVGNATLLAKDGLVALPSTVIQDGALSWQVDPADTGWQLGDAHTALDVLRCCAARLFRR